MRGAWGEVIADARGRPYDGTVLISMIRPASLPVTRQNQPRFLGKDPRDA
ncbi:MAG: hypothetical protein ACI9EF_001627 [Pseudohongiellaceae bacterium]|jgi:hypothetical protein